MIVAHFPLEFTNEKFILFNYTFGVSDQGHNHFLSFYSLINNNCTYLGSPHDILMHMHTDQIKLIDISSSLKRLHGWRLGTPLFHSFIHSFIHTIGYCHHTMLCDTRNFFQSLSHMNRLASKEADSSSCSICQVLGGPSQDQGSVYLKYLLESWGYNISGDPLFWRSCMCMPHTHFPTKCWSRASHTRQEKYPSKAET